MTWIRFAELPLLNSTIPYTFMQLTTLSYLGLYNVSGLSGIFPSDLLLNNVQMSRLLIVDTSLCHLAQLRVLSIASNILVINF